MRLLILLAAFFLIASTAVLVLTNAPASPLEDKDVTISELRAWFEDGIRNDPAATYQTLKEGYTREKFEVRHVMAHLFAEVLYDLEGVEGIKVCDTDFNFGCYHGFVSTAVGTDGFDVIEPLQAVCATFDDPEFETCQHGIGHGILEYLGHDELVAALAVCERTDQSGPLGGCMSGVFMEYNVSLTLDAEGDYQVAKRPLLDPENPYAPCDTFDSSTYAQACYHELPRWWKQVYPEDYVLFGDFCAALEDDANRVACQVGIARAVPSSADFDVTASEALCAQAGDGDVYNSCIIRAAWSFETNNQDHERARALCAFAPEERRHECPA